MTTIARYYEIRKQADSVREIAGHDCSVIPGSNDGYFIQAFGVQYRFASIECPAIIARLFKEIVSFGPIEC